MVATSAPPEMTPPPTRVAAQCSSGEDGLPGMRALLRGDFLSLCLPPDDSVKRKEPSASPEVDPQEMPEVLPL